MTQSELGLFEPKPEPEDVQWLEALLRRRASWLSAKAVVLNAELKLHDRDVRALASASDKIISGQKGYRHIECATPEEIHHASAWLMSQGKKMIRRAVAIRRRAHKLIGPNTI